MPRTTTAAWLVDPPRAARPTGARKGRSSLGAQPQDRRREKFLEVLGSVLAQTKNYERAVAEARRSNSQLLKERPRSGEGDHAIDDAINDMFGAVAAQLSAHREQCTRLRSELLDLDPESPGGGRLDELAESLREALGAMERIMTNVSAALAAIADRMHAPHGAAPQAGRAPSGGKRALVAGAAQLAAQQRRIFDEITAAFLAGHAAAAQAAAQPVRPISAPLKAPAPAPPGAAALRQSVPKGSAKGGAKGAGESPKTKAEGEPPGTVLPPLPGARPASGRVTPTAPPSGHPQPQLQPPATPPRVPSQGRRRGGAAARGVPRSSSMPAQPTPPAAGPPSARAPRPSSHRAAGAAPGAAKPSAPRQGSFGAARGGPGGGAQRQEHGPPPAPAVPRPPQRPSSGRRQGSFKSGEGALPGAGRQEPSAATPGQTGSGPGRRGSSGGPPPEQGSSEGQPPAGAGRRPSQSHAGGAPRQGSFGRRQQGQGAPQAAGRHEREGQAPAPAASEARRGSGAQQLQQPQQRRPAGPPAAPGGPPPPPRRDASGRDLRPRASDGAVGRLPALAAVAKLAGDVLHCRALLEVPSAPPAPASAEKLKAAGQHGAAGVVAHLMAPGPKAEPRVARAALQAAAALAADLDGRAACVREGIPGRALRLLEVLPGEALDGLVAPLLAALVQSEAGLRSLLQSQGRAALPRLVRWLSLPAEADAGGGAGLRAAAAAIAACLAPHGARASPRPAPSPFLWPTGPPRPGDLLGGPRPLAAAALQAAAPLAAHPRLRARLCAPGLLAWARGALAWRGVELQRPLGRLLVGLSVLKDALANAEARGALSEGEARAVVQAAVARLIADESVDLRRTALAALASLTESGRWRAGLLEGPEDLPGLALGVLEADLGDPISQRCAIRVIANCTDAAAALGMADELHAFRRAVLALAERGSAAVGDGAGARALCERLLAAEAAAEAAHARDQGQGQGQGPEEAAPSPSPAAAPPGP
eukprot:tig00000248_g21775.t1